MQILQASAHLADTVKSIIAVGMASHLLRKAADLHDETSVTVSLAQAGFGAASIRALRGRAADIAQQAKAAAISKAN